MNLLAEAFYQLPARFDPAPLLEELKQIPKTEWQDNPQGFFGIESLVLISSQGRDTHFHYGEMAACSRLDRLPNIRSLLSIFEAPLGTTRIMRLAPGAKVQPHVDLHHYWKHRFRIHLVLQTHPDAIFGCRDQLFHLPAGQIWTSDSWSPHFVENNSEIDRIHIVVDTLGSEKVWEWLNKAWNSSFSSAPVATEKLPPINHHEQELHVEKYGDSVIKHPAEVSEIIQDILLDCEVTPETQSLLHRLNRGWREIWAEWGHTNIFPYRAFLQDILARLETHDQATLHSNQVSVSTLLNVQLSIPADLPLQIRKPIFILGAPRSGQAELLRLLSGHAKIWTLPRTLDLFEHIPELHPQHNDYRDANIIDAEITPDIGTKIGQFLRQGLQNSRYSSHSKHPNPLKDICFVDASPKNIFRVSAILKLFPQARFIYLHQNPIRNLHSIMDGWKTAQFVPYLELPHWHHKYPWSFTLIPNWQQLTSKPLSEICFAQYKACHEHILQARKHIPSAQIFDIDSEQIEKNTGSQLRRLFRFLQLPLPQHLSSMRFQLPRSKSTIENAIALQQLASEIEQFYQGSIAILTTKQEK